MIKEYKFAMSVFLITWVLAIVFAIISFIFFIIAFFVEKAKYSIIAAFASAIVSSIFLFNIKISEPIIEPLDNEIQIYESDVSVTVKSEEPFFKIYYSLDGTDPKFGSVYEDTIILSQSTTVCARCKFFWMWSNINQNTYKFKDLPSEKNQPEMVQPEEKLSKTITVKVDNQDVEIDRITKIPINSDYPNITMEAKTTSFFSSHKHNEDIKASDIVSDPFISSIDDLDGLYQEIKEEILRNPVYGDMIARGLVNDSNWFSDNLPWLNDFINKTNQFFEREEINIEKILEEPVERPIGMAGWLMESEDEPEKWYVNVEYRLYAEKICNLLDKFTILGVHKYTSDGYWYLYVMFPSSARTSYQETETKLDAFILCMKASSEIKISILGFDLQDKGLLHYKHSTIDL